MSDNTEPTTDKPCFHRDTRWQQLGDGTPVEYCRDCGRNISFGQRPAAALAPQGVTENE